MHSTLGQPGRLAGEEGDGLGPRGRSPGLDADAEWTDRAHHRGAAAGGPVGQLAGARLISSVRSSSPKAESFTGFAPKVLVSRISAPART